MPDAGPAEFVCTVKAPTECTTPNLRYADVKPAFDAYCVNCHSTESMGQWPLADYQSIADWSDIVRDNLVECSMPPYDGGVPMADEPRDKILNWLRCGAMQ